MRTSDRCEVTPTYYNYSTPQATYWPRLKACPHRQWRRSRGGPGVRTPPLFGSVGVRLYMDPPLFTAVQRL